MISPPDSRAATADRLRALRRSGLLPQEAFERAIELVCASPKPVAWRNFLDGLLLALGAALVLAGVVFFVAFNWAQLGRLEKLGLAAALVSVAAAGAFRLGLEQLPGKISLTAAAVLVGPLLAVFGQSYQTGADPYQLFLGWAVLVAIWVVISGFPPLWLIALLLINVTLVLFWSQELDPSGGDLFHDHRLVAAIVALNTSGWIGWEIFAARGSPLVQGRWGARLLATVSFGLLTVRTLAWIFDSGDVEWLLGLMFVPMVIGTIVVFLTLRRDLYMLAAASGSAMVLFTTLSGKFLFSDLGSDEVLFGIFALGAIVITEVAAVAWWLRVTHRRWEASPQ